MEKIQSLGKCIKTLDEIEGTVRLVLEKHNLEIPDLKNALIEANEEFNKTKHLGQCEATTDKGRRCCREQHPDHMPFCKVHRYGKVTKYICLHGSINVDDNEIPWFSISKKACKHDVIHNSWFCKRHEKYQNLAKTLYGYNSLQDYNDSIENHDFIADEQIENYKNKYNI